MIKLGSILESKQNQNGQNVLILQEAITSNGGCYSFKLLNVPADCIAIKSDNFHAPVEFFETRPPKGQTRRADYIVLASFKSKNWIIFIEMKKGRGNRRKIAEQLKGSQCLLDYCRSLGRNFWEQNNFLDSSNYQKRFVSLKQINLNKSPSLPRTRRRSAHDTPENMITIAGGDQLVFKKLINY